MRLWPTAHARSAIGPEEEFATIIAAGYTNLDFQVS
jgi:hypothetical protein